MYVYIYIYIFEKNTNNDIPRPWKMLNKRCELIARCRHWTKFKP